MRISPIYNMAVRYKSNKAVYKAGKSGKPKDVTEDYKKSLLTKKVVGVKFGPVQCQDPKLWQPQPKKVCIGKRNGVSIFQYVSPFTKQR